MDSNQIKLAVTAAIAVGGIAFGVIEHNNLASKEKELGALQLEVIDLNQRAAQLDELKKHNEALEEHVKQLEARLAPKAKKAEMKKGVKAGSTKKTAPHKSIKSHKKQ